MLNIRNIPKSAQDQQLFVEEMARLLMPWGVPQAAARLYGYLLLRPAPTSLDQITVDLEIGKSTASTAARLLEQYTLVRRRSERGTKRALYEASEDYEGILNGQKQILHAMAALLKKGTRTAGSGAAKKRLEEMAEFYRIILGAMEAAQQKWSAQRSK